MAASADEATPRRWLRVLPGLEGLAAGSVADSVVGLTAVVAEAGSVADAAAVSEEAATLPLVVSGTGTGAVHHRDPAASTDATATEASLAVGMTREMEGAHMTTDAAVVAVTAMAAAVGTVIAITV